MEKRANGESWTAQDGKDAARLLAEMSRRSKKAVEAVSSTQIAESREVSGAAKEAGDDAGGVASPRPVTVASRGGLRSDGFANDNGGDRSLIEGMEAPVASAGGVQRMGS